MYSFSIKRDLVPVVEITIDNNMIKENIYLQNLIEKCFEKVFQVIIRDDNEKDVDSLEEIDLKEDNNMIRENIYLQNLIKKCFEKVFQVITRDEKDVDSLEEVDLEEDN